MSDDEEAFPNASPINDRGVKKVEAKRFGDRSEKALATRRNALLTMTRQEAFDKGYITVQDLDDEELRYGRCRDENGLIPQQRGKKTYLIPKDKYDEMIAEHEMRFKQKLRQNLDDMLEIMVDIAKDDTVEPRDRFEAAKYLFERTAGRTPETVNVTVKGAPYEELLGSVTGIGAISRAEHRRLAEEGSAGIIDVEVVDEDGLPTEYLQDGSKGIAKPDLVPVHQTRPDEQDEPSTEPAAAQQTQAWDVDGDGHAQPTYQRDPAQQQDQGDLWAPVQVDAPEPHLKYGSKRTEAKSYVDQAREAAALATRRKEAKAKIQDAKKQRKIARATGADAITDEITGATVGDDGKLTFE